MWYERKWGRLFASYALIVTVPSMIVPLLLGLSGAEFPTELILLVLIALSIALISLFVMSTDRFQFKAVRASRASTDRR
jgi:hypothetical protein